MNLQLNRFDVTTENIMGTLTLDDGTKFCTLECPWLDNKPYISCIPEGQYNIALTNSPRFGLVYHVQHVPNRTHILFHKGNYACSRDESDRHTDSYGCILIGSFFGNMVYRDGSERKFRPQRTVMHSSKSFEEFMSKLYPGNGHTLTITSGPVGEQS